jgi:thioredoxin reductase
MSDDTPAIKIIGRPGSPEAYAIRDFLNRNDVQFEWHPTPGAGSVRCEFRDGTHLENPTIRQISERLVHGGSCLDAATLKNNHTRRTEKVETHWLFVCSGGQPNTNWAIEAGVIRDEAGYLVTGPDLAKDGHRPDGWPLDRDPYFFETNLPGLFAAGDVRHGSIKRCASAVGEGAMTVTLVHRYLAQG